MRIVGIIMVLVILSVLYVGTGGESAVSGSGSETSPNTSAPTDAGFANFK